ncbi:MAG: S-layer homology domain-containing protein, partial [Oscillospiraceae bacterium]|nr:S-layer homology domain-containing protein [Oscillospiraceae bacterium]
DGSECACEKPKTANSPEWYIFYGYGNPKGYLYNELYPEIRESNLDPWGDKITWNKDADGNDIGAFLGTYEDPDTGEVLWSGGDMWGVDDGWGYLPGRKYADDGNLEERHGYIAYYNYRFWMTIYGHVKNLSEAYVYTSDPKYGRAGIILLDRIADVWPHFDSYYFKDLFLNTSGGHGAGAATGRINDHNLARYFGFGADAFYPMINDPQVIQRLSADAEKYGLDNPKTSSDLIWRNIADGILIANADMCMDGRINGNFGQAQSVAAIAAIALNEQPKTDEIIEWLYKPTRATSGNSPVPGGDIERKIINDVDRDGMGNEASPRYNTSWVGVLGLFADNLCRYEGEQEYNLYANAKFAKMYDPQINITLTHSKHPNIGDAGSPASVGFNGSSSVWYNAFTAIDNEYYKKKIAQYIWYFTDGNLSQFGNNILLENPGGAEEELLKYIDKDAAMGSQMLTGYGFAALRDGKNYKSVSASSDNNNQRDFWMWFGYTGASHAHNDALNIGIDAFGLDLAPDLGYPEDTSYTPNRLQWVRTALSHNLVVVDENGQAGSTHIHGFPMHFDDSGKVKVMDADMKEVYKQTENYRRTIVMIEANDDVSYGIDFFRITGGKHHLYSFHSQAENAYPISGIELTPDPIVQDENGNDIVGSYAGADVPYGKDPWTQNTWSYPTKYPRGYTWLKNVRRDNSPENQFTIEFDVQDYRKVLKDSSGIKLRLTQVNDFTPTEVAIAGGYMTQKSETKMMPETWDYVLVERDGKGEELDSLFTTVYQPYRNTPYIESIEGLEVKIKSGSEIPGDMARAVKVKHTEANGGRCDYVVYATNKDVVYTITDGDFSFDFKGFVGVYTLNANGGIIYRYVNDGDIIGEETGKASEYTGKVVDFQKENAFENYIDVEIDCEDLSDLSEKYIYVNNDGVENGVYRIASATDSAEGLRDGCVRLDLETVTLIRGHIDQQDLDKGYEYNIKEGQTFRIPTSFVDESVPEFKEIENNISASVGSVVTLPITAESPTGAMVTYSSNSLPRGASLDSESGVITWKPTASQIGENHVGVTARDSDGREATIHLTVTVYGSTSAGSSGGGGGGETTTPTIPSDEKENDKEPSTDVGEDIILPPAESDVRFTDLGNHAWAEDAINALADKGIIKGTSETTYSPANNITRADFALLLVRAFEKESDNTENFADVSETDYFAKELAIARNTGLVGGVGDNKFAPRNNITRQDMMLMVYRIIKDMDAFVGRADLGTPEYADFDQVADYAREAVSALIGAGLVNGKNGLIAPNDYTTRAEVAVLISRILDFVKNK